MNYFSDERLREVQLCISGAACTASGADMGFCITGEADGAWAAGTQAVAGLFSDVRSDDAADLLKGVSRELKAACASRRVALMEEVFLPVTDSLRQPSFLNGYPPPIIASFAVDRTARGIVGVTRKEAGPGFSLEARVQVAAVGQVAANLLKLQVDYDELKRREAIRLSLPGLVGTYCVVDLAQRKISWVYTTDGAESCEDALRDIEGPFVDTVERQALSAANDGAKQGYPRLPFAQIIQMADLGSQPLFAAERAMVVALAPKNDIESALSNRERQIAKLLTDGYTGVNVAAILEVSENTIRTYVRRIYRKLEVANRAELTKKFWVRSPSHDEPRLASRQ